MTKKIECFHINEDMAVLFSFLPADWHVYIAGLVANVIRWIQTCFYA